MTRRCPILAVVFGLIASAALAEGSQFRAVKPGDPTAAGEPRSGHSIRIQGIAFDPQREYPDFSEVGFALKRDARYGLVQLDPADPAAKRRLQAKGVRFYGYVPDHAFQVQLTPATRRILTEDPGVRWFNEYEAGFKVDRRLWPGGLHPASGEIVVRVFPDESIDETARRIQKLHPDAFLTRVIDDGAAPRARFSVLPGDRDEFVALLAQTSGVSWIEPYTEMYIQNQDALGPVQNNAPGAEGRTIFAHGLTGTGQIIAVSDSGLDADMCFFTQHNGVSGSTPFDDTIQPELGASFPDRKVVAYWVQEFADAYDDNATCPDGSPTGFHGTHVTGSLAGDNRAHPSSPTDPGLDSGDGMAPNAQILFQDAGAADGCLSGLQNPFGTYEQALLGGARIHSNSWGGNTNGNYTLDEVLVDQFLFDNEEMLIFFAAGNFGPAASTLNSPGNAKNSVSVGALGTGNSTLVVPFSSRGPTEDGRIKPDIVAPGSSILSASGNNITGDGNCFTSDKSGTSMATPVTAGSAALIRQYFTDGFYPTGSKNTDDAWAPTATMLKAALLNGTRPLPDNGEFGGFTFGWGRVFLDNNLFFPGDARKMRAWAIPNPAGMEQGEVHTYTVTVVAGQEFRATLVWSDPEATEGANITLVNNLDLEVSNGSDTFKGNVFNSNGISTAGGNADTLNNVEQVRFTAPAAGAYTIRVRAASLPGNGRFLTDRQGYALVASHAECQTGVTGAPAGLSATTNANLGIDLRWDPAAGSTVTQVYRAPAGTTDASQFQYIGSSTTTLFTDTRAIAGITYVYRVRGAGGCGEGPASSSISFASTGGCDLEPDFAGAATAAPGGPDCHIVVSWGEATSRCPSASSIYYNVYRSTEAGFLPSGEPFTTVVDETSFTDFDVVSGTKYYYIVRAENAVGGGRSGPNGGTEDGNLKRVAVTSQGGGTVVFSDDGGDTSSSLQAQNPWHVTSRQAQAGSKSWFFGVEGGGDYPADTCAALTTPAISVPPGAELSYWNRYQIEFKWDGVIVEVSTDGGTTWSDLPPDEGYPSNLSESDTTVNACGYPASHGAFNGPRATSTGLTSWARWSNDLAAFEGMTIRLRWRFTTDPGVELEGFYLDTIAVTVPTECTAALVKPEAGFEIMTRSAVSGTAVQFEDHSDNSPTSWLWSFGDNATSTLASPTHIYTTPGRYTVSLTATNGAGSSATTEEIVIFDANATYEPRAINPGQARAQGANNSFFKTALWATNTSATETVIRLRYVPSPGATLAGADETVLLAIRPNESVSFTDVLTEALGATENTGGAIVVELQDGKALPIVTSRTYNEPGPYAGTFGQYIPAVPLASGPGSEVFIDGLGGDAKFRSNVGVVNLTDAAITAAITVVDTSGVTKGQPVVIAVPARSAVQENGINTKAGAGTLSVFGVRVTATGAFFAYASKLDNVTSDPIFVPDTLRALSRQWVDGVGAVPGAGGTFFRSNLSISNRGAVAALVTLQYTPRGSTAPSMSEPVSVPASSTAFYSDAIPQIFGIEGAGTLTITSDSATPVVVWARTYNDRGTSGTLGQFIPAFGPADLIGSNGALLQGLSENPGYRTNLGLVNTSAATVGATISAWRKDGTKLSERVYVLAGGQSLFVQKIFQDILAGAQVADGYLKIIPSNPDALYAWASYVDNRSTDQTFVRPLPIE